MNEIIDTISQATGVDTQRVRRATGIIVNFLSIEGPPDAVSALLDGLPGSRELAAETGGGSGGLWGVFNELTGTGLGMGEIRSIARALLASARAKAGAEKVDAVVAGIPGLAMIA
jgi:hypothetical protein